jgi:hypothetical protein
MPIILDDYTVTLDRMEPDIAVANAGADSASIASIAISLKRIADTLDLATNSEYVADLIAEVRSLLDKEWRE